jgi:protein-arginine kinase activator protein McsA
MPKQEVYTCEICNKSAPISHADAADYMVLHGVRVKRTWKKTRKKDEGADFHRTLCPRCMDTFEQILEALEKNIEGSG